MGICKKYCDYLRDNPRGYWFKRKLYGWGWTPARWQGWCTMVVFIVLMVGNFYRLDVASRVGQGPLTTFLIETAVLIIVLIAVCYKTGEKPRWQWGLPKDKDR